MNIEDIQGWFNFEKVYDIAIDNCKIDDEIVEVGCWLGRSTAYLANIAQKKNIKIYAVDTWLGSENEKEHKELISKMPTSLYELFLDNMFELGFTETIKPIRALSVEASNNFSKNQLGFVFIDGDHRYLEVKNDIKAWYDKVRIGGIIGGHDYTNAEGVKYAVDELFYEHDVQFFKNSWYLIKTDKPLSLDQHAIIDAIDSKKRFAFSRFGDGEWKCILGIQGQNCDGHSFFPDMGYELRKILLSEKNYRIGIQQLARELFNDKIDIVLSKNNLNINWDNSDLFHYLSKNFKLYDLFEIFDKNHTVMVGPNYLKEKFGYNKFIEVPEKNCWLSASKIKNELIDYLINSKQEYTVILFVASMAANVLIDRVWRELPDMNFCLLDMGSVFDPYIGKSTRSYHNKMIERLQLV